MNAMLVGLCVLALAALVLVALPLPSATAEESADATTPVELGAVRWLRSFEAAVAKAQTDGRALLVLFQEVPG